MTANHVLGSLLYPSALHSSESRRTSGVPEAPFSYGHACGAMSFANFTREVNDLPNATVAISLSPSAGWVNQLAGITNVDVKIGLGSDVRGEIGVNEIVGTGIFCQGSRRLDRRYQLSYKFADFEPETLYQGAGFLPSDAIVGGFCETAVLWGNIDQITTSESVDLAALAQQVVSQEGLLSAQLRRLCKLEPAWDGETALPVSGETVATAKEIIRQIFHCSLVASVIPTVHLGPLPDGSLRFECKHSNRELFLTVSEKLVEIQTWQPLESVEALGYWQTDLAGTREHLEWLVK